MTIPSHLVKPETVVTAVDREKSKKLVAQNVELSKGEGIPPWLACDPQRAELKVLKMPAVDEFSFPIQSNLIVELLAK